MTKKKHKILAEKQWHTVWYIYTGLVGWESFFTLDVVTLMLFYFIYCISRSADESVWQSQFNYVATAQRFTTASHKYIYIY